MGEKGVGEEGAQSGISKVVGSKRKREKLCNIAQIIFCNQKNEKRWDPTNTGQEPGLKGTESEQINPPCPAPYASRPQRSGLKCMFIILSIPQQRRHYS